MAQTRSKNNLLSVEIMKKISDMIIAGNMSPGTKLPNETQLADIYSVSRSTIREALKSLKAQNIVIIRQGDGTYVSDNTGRMEDPLGLKYLQKESLIEDIFEARLLIEPQIAMLAVERATDQEIAIIKSIVDRMQEIDYHNPSRMLLDIKFHTLLAKCTNNDVLNKLVPVIYETIERGVVLLYESEESHTRAQIAHAEIYDALFRREAWKIQHAVISHIYSSLNDIHKLGKGASRK